MQNILNFQRLLWMQISTANFTAAALTKSQFNFMEVGTVVAYSADKHAPSCIGEEERTRQLKIENLSTYDLNAFSIKYPCLLPVRSLEKIGIVS